MLHGRQLDSIDTVLRKCCFSFFTSIDNEFALRLESNKFKMENREKRCFHRKHHKHLVCHFSEEYR